MKKLFIFSVFFVMLTVFTSGIVFAMPWYFVFELDTIPQNIESGQVYEQEISFHSPGGLRLEAFFLPVDYDPLKVLPFEFVPTEHREAGPLNRVVWGDTLPFFYTTNLGEISICLLKITNRIIVLSKHLISHRAYDAWCIC